MNSIFSSKKKIEAKISERAMEACESIISEMGAELHDDLIQRLSILRLSIDKLERSLSNRTESETILLRAKIELNDVIQSVRTISRKLLPVRINTESFDQAISMLCQNMEISGTRNIHFKTSGQKQRLSNLAELYLYRIIQELIHNSLKHSAAWNVWVRFNWLETELNIQVEDDGTGFSKVSTFIDLLRTKHGSIKMRSQAIQASIDYKHGPNGLLAQIRVPIKYGTIIR